MLYLYETMLSRCIHLSDLFSFSTFFLLELMLKSASSLLSSRQFSFTLTIELRPKRVLLSDLIKLKIASELLAVFRVFGELFRV